MAVPATVVYFTSYEQLKALFAYDEKNLQDWWKPMASGATARGTSFCQCQFDFLFSKESSEGLFFSALHLNVNPF